MKTSFFQKHSALRYLILILIAAIVGINLYTANASLLGNHTPMPFGVGASVVLSGSMEPALSVGDLLIITREETYATGDIVVYHNGNMAVVHRLKAIEDGMAITQGDANNAPDKPFPAEAIQGKVAAAVPVVGHLVWAIKTPLGTLAILAAAVALVELSCRKEQDEEALRRQQIKDEIRQLMKELGKEE